MSIRKEIWKLSYPVMIVITLNTLFGMVDLKFISYLGTVPTAGTALATSLLEVVMVMSSMISAGTMAIAARSVGAGNSEEYADVAKQSILFSIAFGLVVYLLANVFKMQLLGIFNSTEESIAYALQYLNIVFITVPISFVTAVLTSILHAKGDTKNPMVALAIANALNILLDWLFIMVFHWGVRGAAAATLLGVVLTLFYLMATVMKALQTNIFHLFSKISLTMQMLKRVIKVGIFSVLYGITRPFTGMLMFRIAAESGVAAVAAFSIGGRWFSLIFIILGGLEAAIAILVGQSLGSKNMEKLKHLIREGLTVGLFSIVVFAVLYLIFPEQLMRIFTKDQQVVAFGMRYLRIVFLGLMFVPFTSVFNAAFRGAGDTMPPMIGALTANWVVKIPLAYLLSRMGMQSDGVWAAIAVSVAAEASVTWLFFKRGNWKSKVV